MKIVLLSDYFQAEIGYAKFKIPQALKKLGHKVTVVTSERYFPFHNYESTMKPLIGERKRKVGSGSEGGLKVFRLPIYFEAFSRTFCKDIESTLKYLKPDLVITYGISSYSSYMAAHLKSKIGYSLVLADSHLPSEFEHGNKILKIILYGTFRLFFSKKISDAADKIVAQQPDTKKIITDVYGIRKPSIVIENGTDCSLYYFSIKKRNEIRKKQNIPPHSQVIIYTGKVIPEKGVHLLLEAFFRLQKNYNNLYCLIVGNATEKYKDECSDIVASCADKVRFIKAVSPDKLYEYYSSADLAVWPLQESLAMNDAAACSLPFIATDSLMGSIRVSNNNAQLYKTGNVSNLVKVISKLLADPKELKQMGKRGRELALAELSWENLAKKYIL